jgi:hypothetical protein
MIGDVDLPRSLQGIQSSRGIGLKHAADFIAHTTEHGELFFLAAGGVSGIIESPMVPVDLSGKHRANLVGISTHGDDGLHAIVQKPVEVFRMMRTDIDADFTHHLDRKGMNVSGGFRAGAFDAEWFAQGIA